MIINELAIRRDNLVIARCITYNQEPYIRECLEGFVKQQTSFPFIAVVHDDASTDRTADIVREYAANYPDKIVAILEKENQYSKVDGTLNRIMDLAIADAKYVAVCEGDDYWTDSKKLQKQVDFMETHPDFSVCFHPVMVLEQQTGQMHPDTLQNVESETTIYDLVANANYIHTPSVMYGNSNSVNEKYACVGKVGVGDYLLHVLHAETGKIKKLDDCMAVYRHGVGVWTGPKSNDEENMIKWIIALSKLSSLLSDKKAQQLLDKQIYADKDMLFEEWQRDKDEIKRLRTTRSYKIGHFLTHPLSWFKNHI